jgi:hypothetical protein
MGQSGVDPLLLEEGRKMMRTSLVAALFLAASTFPVLAEGPVKGVAQGTKEIGQGAVQGTAQAGRGVAQGTVTVARGAGEATVGVARGTATVAKKTGKGVWCIVTLGYGC